MEFFDLVVIVPTFNSGEFLEQTIDSLVSQQFSGKLLIFITDDESKDNSCDIIKNYKSLYPDIIEYRFNEKNLGIGQNVFSAYHVYPTKYLFTFSGDDFIIDKLFLQKQFDLLENNKNVSVSFFDGYKFFGKDTENRFEHFKEVPKEGEFDLTHWGENGFFPFNHQTIVFRYESLPQFEPWMFESEQEDWLLIFLLLLNGNGLFTNEKASMYRNHENNYSHSGNSYKKIKGGINLIKNINNYTNFKYTTLFGDQSWRYERFFFACLNEKKYMEGFAAFFKFLFSKSSLKFKVRFLKTFYRKMILRIEPSY
jgi:glycosyltransferase involved in cell wall biosynthesis